MAAYTVIVDGYSKVRNCSETRYFTVRAIDHCTAIERVRRACPEVFDRLINDTVRINAHETRVLFR